MRIRGHGPKSGTTTAKERHSHSQVAAALHPPSHTWCPGGELNHCGIIAIGDLEIKLMFLERLQHGRRFQGRVQLPGQESIPWNFPRFVTLDVGNARRTWCTESKRICPEGGVVRRHRGQALWPWSWYTANLAGLCDKLEREVPRNWYTAHLLP